jgi:hypothetical protein
MDTMKIARGVYQYTAIDDCSRFRVLAVYPRRNARNTLLFLDRVIEEMPFPIQRIQTDRGGEFFAESVQRRLMSECINCRPIPPRSPHLNGKVERSQLTDLNEFWSNHAPTEDEIDRRIEEWKFDYDWRRPHGSLGGKTPVDRTAELGEITPLAQQVQSAYDGLKERIRHREWRVDKTLAEHHRRALELASPTGATNSSAPGNGIQESETMSVNRTSKSLCKHHRSDAFARLDQRCPNDPIADSNVFTIPDYLALIRRMAARRVRLSRLIPHALRRFVTLSEPLLIQAPRFTG